MRLPRPIRYLLQILFVVGATAIANFFLLKPVSYTHLTLPTKA